VKVFNVLDVNEAYHVGRDFFARHIALAERGEAAAEVRKVPTRQGGHVWEARGPVATVYRRPVFRVLFDPQRDAHPFFHLMEGMWLLAARNDVDFLAYFLKNIRQFSDNGKDFHGGYGARLGSELPIIMSMLHKDPASRRAYAAIFEPRDLGAQSLDIPCNVGVAFSARDGYLDMTVFNRSNDMIWGAYGANAVQFSFVQEYIAGAIGAHVGTYTQVSNSFHVYPDTWAKIAPATLGIDAAHQDPYQSADAAGRFPVLMQRGGFASIHPMFSLPNGFHEPGDPVEDFGEIQADLGTLQTLPAEEVGPTRRWVSPFFKQVVAPMAQAFYAYKAGDYEVARDILREDVMAPDWAAAADAWVARRQAKKEMAA